MGSKDSKSFKVPVNGIKAGNTVRFNNVPVDFIVVDYSKSGRGVGWP